MDKWTGSLTDRQCFFSHQKWIGGFWLGLEPGVSNRACLTLLLLVEKGVEHC